MTDDTISRPSRTMAAAVSSQELSMPRTSMLIQFESAEFKLQLLFFGRNNLKVEL